MITIAVSGMEIGRWTFAIGLGLFASLCIASNSAVVIRYWRRGKTGSTVPFVGGAVGAGALLLVPLGTLSQRAAWLWVPLFLDWTSLWIFVWIAKQAIGRIRRSAPRHSN